MLRWFPLLALLVLSGSLAFVRRRLPLREWSRIVNGEDANPGEYPSQLSLQNRNRHSCGASILSDNWALTAAHCVAGRSPSDLTLLAGTNTLNSGGSKHQVQEIIIHSAYNPGDSWVNDIAVLKVQQPFLLDDTRKPISLPTQDETTEANSVATVIGWGRLSQGGQLPNVLQKVNIFISEQSSCQAVYNDIGYDVYPTQICADFPQGNKGSCNGDSGGPLFVNGEVVGLVSWANGCATKGYPTVYTRVSAYRTWITQQTGV